MKSAKMHAHTNRLCVLEGVRQVLCKQQVQWYSNEFCLSLVFAAEIFHAAQNDCKRKMKLSGRSTCT